MLSHVYKLAYDVHTTNIEHTVRRPGGGGNRTQSENRNYALNRSENKTLLLACTRTVMYTVVFVAGEFVIYI